MATKMYLYQKGNNFKIDFWDTDFEDGVRYIQDEMVDWINDLHKTDSLADYCKLEIVWGTSEWEPTVQGKPISTNGSTCNIIFSDLTDATAFKLTFWNDPNGCIIVK